MGGEGGEPNGSQALGGPPSVAQPPTAGVAVGVVADGVVRACQVLESPVVPHLPVPEHDCISRGGLFATGVENSMNAPISPLHVALEFDTLTPNPSAPSQSLCAAVVFCAVCGVECGPDSQFGKCGSCLDAAFNSFAALHVPELVPHFRNSIPAEALGGPPSAKRARRLSPPHRKAGPPI